MQVFLYRYHMLQYLIVLSISRYVPAESAVSLTSNAVI